jgi:hypothetical protein
MARSRGGVRLGPPEGGKDSPVRAARGRRCREPGCSTVLSTYNRSETCYLHTAPSYRPPLQRS